MLNNNYLMLSKNGARETYVFFVFSLFVFGETITLRRECPTDEFHKSCSFYDEYTCWDKPTGKRMMAAPNRLLHCQSGCYCKKGLVRSYPNGPCIIAHLCRDQRIQIILSRLPP